VRDNIESGSSLSAALSKYPNVFSALYINMVKAGESSGMLDEILERLAGYLEKANSLRRKVRSSLIYPTLVVVMAVGITSVLMLYVVPTFKGIFESLGGELPKLTQLLLAISDLLRHSFVFLLAGVVLFGFVFSRYLRTDTGRMQFDRFLLRMPIFGIIMRKVAVARFSRTLATLIRSGVPILGSLEIVGKTSGNKVVERAVDGVRTSIREGENIAEPLARSGVFPPMVTRMIGVGEQAGELEKMLTKIADFYEDQVDAAVSGLASTLEPVIIIFLGVVVGFIVIAMFMPIFKLPTMISAM
jgi:type IV pilus assembly protein PilC